MCVQLVYHIDAMGSNLGLNNMLWHTLLWEVFLFIYSLFVSVCACMHACVCMHTCMFRDYFGVKLMVALVRQQN